MVSLWHEPNVLNGVFSLNCDISLLIKCSVTLVLSRGQKWRPETKSSASLTSAYCSKRRSNKSFSTRYFPYSSHYWHTPRGVLSVYRTRIYFWLAFNHKFPTWKWGFGGWGLSLCAIFFFGVAAWLHCKLNPGCKCRWLCVEEKCEGIVLHHDPMWWPVMLWFFSSSRH